MSEAWRKAEGVLRGAIPPGETPESMIRRLRDGDAPTDADRALAVLDRLLRAHRDGWLCARLDEDGEYVAWIETTDTFSPIVRSDSPAAALLALGAKLAGGEDGE